MRPTRFSDTTPPSKRVPKAMPPPQQKGGSLDRRRKHDVIELDPVILTKTPILCNRYVIGKNDIIGNNVQNEENFNSRRAKSLPRSPQYLEPPQFVPTQPPRRPSPKRKKSPRE